MKRFLPLLLLSAVALGQSVGEPSWIKVLEPSFVFRPAGGAEPEPEPEPSDAVRFDALADTLIRSATIPDTTSLTVAGWFYQSAVSSGAGGDLFAFYTPAGLFANEFAVYYADGTSNLSFYGGDTGDTPSVATFSTGVWVYVALTADSTGAAGFKVYAAEDGDPLALELSQNRTVVAVPTRIEIGGFARYSEWFNGRVAHFRIWTAVLSQAELELERASPTAVKTSGLWAAIELQDATGADTSGNSRNFTPAGTLTIEEGPTL